MGGEPRKQDVRQNKCEVWLYIHGMQSRNKNDQSNSSFLLERPINYFVTVFSRVMELFSLRRFCVYCVDTYVVV